MCTDMCMYVFFVIEIINWTHHKQAAWAAEFYYWLSETRQWRWATENEKAIDLVVCTYFDCHVNFIKLIHDTL